MLARLSGRLLTLAGLAFGLLGADALAGIEQQSDPQEFLSPARGEVLAPGSIVEIQWASACEPDRAERLREERDWEEKDADEGERDAGEREAEIVLSLDGGMTFPVRISTELSPCTTRFRWRVPALSTTQARLGLRTGEEGREETEEIEFVSERFTILADPEGRNEALVSRGAEWWTPEEPSQGSAEDGLGRTIGDATSRMAAPVRWAEAGDPSSAAHARPTPRVARAAAASAQPLSVNAKSLASSPSAPTPLRC